MVESSNLHLVSLPSDVLIQELEALLGACIFKYTDGPQLIVVQLNNFSTLRWCGSNKHPIFSILYFDLVLACNIHHYALSWCRTAAVSHCFISHVTLRVNNPHSTECCVAMMFVRFSALNAFQLTIFQFMIGVLGHNPIISWRVFVYNFIQILLYKAMGTTNIKKIVHYTLLIKTMIAFNKILVWTLHGFTDIKFFHMKNECKSYSK
jgi:hypothetical protein